MNRNQTIDFQLYVMDLAENCQTADELRKLSMELHESIEGAMLDMCIDNGIEDYEPPY